MDALCTSVCSILEDRFPEQEHFNSINCSHYCKEACSKLHHVYIVLAAETHPICLVLVSILLGQVVRADW